MCELAEIYTDGDVLHLTFEEMDFDEVFDGIWACASLLHVPSDEMPDIMKKVLAALKPGGILYFSVYEGDRDGMYGGRYYCDYTKSGIRRLMSQFDNAEILDIWTTDDVRQDISDRQWLNLSLIHIWRLKRVLEELFGREKASVIPVLYGGSVNPGNVVPLISQPWVDGLFIGRSAWKAESFNRLIRMVLQSRTE